MNDAPKVIAYIWVPENSSRRETGRFVAEKIRETGCNKHRGTVTRSLVVQV